MEYQLTKWDQSNYHVTLTFTDDDLAKYKTNVLSQMQKDLDMPGFRKGHVPLDMVEKNVNQQVLFVGVLEEGINGAMQQIVQEHEDTQFIWQIYDVTPDEEDTSKLTFSVDVYPEVEVKNDNRKATKLDTIDTPITDEEKQQTLDTLRRQYANYEDTDAVSDETITKVSLSYQDADGKEMSERGVYVGQEEYEQYSDLNTLLSGKKVDDTVELPHDDKLPALFGYQSKSDEDDATPATVMITIKEIKSVILPEFTDENIGEYFGEEIKSVDELHTKITEVLNQEKEVKLLVDAIDGFLTTNAETFGVTIPKSIIDQEVEWRMKNMTERLWGDEKFAAFRENMTDEQKKQMDDEIRSAAGESLTKFFILKTIAEELGVWEKINFEEELNMERTIYGALRDLG